MTNIKNLKIELAELQLKLSNTNYDDKIDSYRKKINGHNMSILFFILQLAGMIFLLIKGIYPKGWLNIILLVLGVGIFAIIRLVFLISKNKQNITDIELERETTLQRVNQLQKEIILAD